MGAIPPKRGTLRWLRHRWERVVALGLVSAAMLFGLFLLLTYAVIPTIVRRMIIQQSEMVQGSRVMEKWQRPQYKMQFKVWVFSVRNPDDVLSGAVPDLRETGPYVFDKTMTNEVLSAGNGTITFKRKVLYHFNEKDSCATCILGNRVWVPNILYQKFTEVASRPSMKAAATALIAQTPFLEVEVGDLLFEGYKDPFVENFCDAPFMNVLCQAIFDLPERIGLFWGMNNSYVDGEYTIKDGTHDISQRAEVLSYNGMPQLKTDWWNSDEARKIRGSEGTLFHPFVQKTDTLWTFANQLCKSIMLLFDADTEYRGVPLMRFKLPISELDTYTPDKTGFCHESDKMLFPQQREEWNEKHCYPKGLLHVGRCRPNEPPIVISLPNFNGAPEEVQNCVKGLNNTDDNRDAITVEIEPSLGLAFLAKRHIQINVEFWAGKDILIPAYHQKQRSTLIPMAVVHDDAEIDEESFRMVKHELINAQRIAYGATSVLACVALTLALGAIVYGLVQSGFLSLLCFGAKEPEHHRVFAASSSDCSGITNGSGSTASTTASALPYNHYKTTLAIKVDPIDELAANGKKLSGAAAAPRPSSFI